MALGGQCIPSSAQQRQDPEAAGVLLMPRTWGRCSCTSRSREMAGVLPVPHTVLFLYKQQEGADSGLALLCVCRAAPATNV